MSLGGSGAGGIIGPALTAVGTFLGGPVGGFIGGVAGAALSPKPDGGAAAPSPTTPAAAPIPAQAQAPVMGAGNTNATSAAAGGPSSTNLSGIGGVDPAVLNLGKNTLLGA